MKKTLAVAAVAMMALSGAAYAQSTNGAGQAPAGTGTNPPGSAGQVATPDTPAAPATQLNEGRASSTDAKAGKTTPMGNDNGNNKTGSNGQ